jgi:ATP-dependent protease Clp ATPase subunit
MINAILNSDNIESLLENYIFKSDNSRTIISKSIFNETYKNLKNNNDFKLDSIEL